MNTVYSHIVVFHGSASNERKELPSNIELVLFTQVGEILPFYAMESLFSILQRNYSTLTTDTLVKCSAYRYAIPTMDTNLNSVFMKVYTSSYDSYYPDLSLTLNEPFLGFYDITNSSYISSINVSSGHLFNLSSQFLQETLIHYGQSFSLSTLLTWISNQTQPNTLSRVYLCCCQAIHPSNIPEIQDMCLDPPETGWPSLEAVFLNATNNHMYNRWNPVV